MREVARNARVEMGRQAQRVAAELKLVRTRRCETGFCSLCKWQNLHLLSLVGASSVFFWLPWNISKATTPNPCYSRFDGPATN
ncbi:MAG: hypothetical protein V5B34_00985 [Accumulibacter sp.]|jgi:hypothetical protein